MFSRRSAFDRYLRRYEKVPGMSSRFSALVCAAVMRLQAKEGWRGNVAEIGAFEGRFLIALALSLPPEERAIAIDLFNWPDNDVEDRFRDRLAFYGLSSIVDVVRADSRNLSSDIISVLGRNRYGIRFFHIDGDHNPVSLISDMRLAFDCMTHWGVVCLDDMLSPAYPELGIVVSEVLKQKEEWIVFCVIDREDIVAASKFLLCRAEYAHFYMESLAFLFEGNVWRMGAQFQQHKALVLSPKPKLKKFHPGGAVSAITYSAIRRK